MRIDDSCETSFSPAFLKKKTEIGQVPERSAWSWLFYQTDFGIFWTMTLCRALRAGVSRTFLSEEMGHPRGAADQLAR